MASTAKVRVLTWIFSFEEQTAGPESPRGDSYSVEHNECIACSTCVRALLRAAAQQHDLGGVEQDVGVERWRQIFDVVQVVFELGDSVLEGVAVFVVNLCPTGYARLHA